MMRKPLFTGACTALVTPFLDNQINYPLMEQLLRRQIDSGITAVVIAGTTGESPTLTDEEKVELFKRCKAYVGDSCTIIAGTGSNDTVYSVELCNDAEAVGADAFLMVAPYYNKTSQAGLVAHYNYIADRVNKPIILYNVPSRTGVAIKPETYKELSKHQNIVAVKEANGDLSAIAKTRYLCGDDLAVYSGNDDQIVPVMSLGGLGVISVLSNVLPYETHLMCHEYLNGNTKKAQEMQLKYTGLIDALFCDVNPIPVKTAMNLAGMNVGPLRLPLYPMNEGNLNYLKEKLLECGIELK